MTYKFLFAVGMGVSFADVTWTEWLVIAWALGTLFWMAKVARDLKREAAKDQQRRLSQIVAISDYRQQARRMR
jgi:uncharacterized phage-like protein YoqJ